MRRPALLTLAAAGLLVLAGCTAPATGPTTSTSTTSTTTTSTTTPTTDATTTSPADPTTTTSQGHYRKYTFLANEISPTHLAQDYVPAPSALSLDDPAFRTALFENGSARTVAIVHADHADEMDQVGPLENDTFVRQGDTYYRIHETVPDRRESTGYRVDLEGPLREGRDEDYDRAKREAVNVSALSRTDRALFDDLLPRDQVLDSGTFSASHFWAFPEGVDPNSSLLVDGEVHYVRYEGTIYRIDLRKVVE